MDAVGAESKDLGWLERRGVSATTAPSMTTSPLPGYRNTRSRWTRRLASLPLVSRTIRGIRWVLGPSRPVPSEQIPPPSPSLSLSFTLASRSYSTLTDPPIVRFVGKWRLNRLLFLFLALWATMLVLLIRQQYYVSGPQIIDCNDAYYDSWPPETCGLNASDCADSLKPGTYRCMGGCQDVTLGNPRWVGGETINGVPMVIGGGDGRYR